MPSKQPDTALTPMAQAFKGKPQLVWLPNEKRWAIYYWIPGRHSWMELMGGEDEPQGFVPDALPDPPPVSS
jgi:hypothetical protein